MARARAERLRRQRHNPDFTVAELLDVLTTHGQQRTAELVARYPEMVEPYLHRLHEQLTRKGAIAKPVADHVAWRQLAKLTPELGLGVDMTAALVREFSRA